MYLNYNTFRQSIHMYLIMSEPNGAYSILLSFLSILGYLLPYLCCSKLFSHLHFHLIRLSFNWVGS